MRKEIVNVLLLTIAFTLLWQTFVSKPDQQLPDQVQGTEIVLESNKDSYVVDRISKPIQVKFLNNLGEDVIIKPCSSDLLFSIEELGTETQMSTCTELAEEEFVLKPGEEMKEDLTNRTHQFFPEAGLYSLSLNWQLVGAEEIQSSKLVLKLKEPSFLTKGWRTLIYRPIYNAVAAIAYFLPHKNLGMGIIILTLLVRTILLVPTNKAMKSQQAMQEIQPKLQELQKKYKDNQAKLAEETMKIWKTHKVNPLGSCLPLLLQAPVMLGIFYAVKSGFDPGHQYIIYDFLNQVRLASLDTNFFGLLELTERNLIVLPLIVGLLQFAQIKLSMVRSKKNNDKKSKKDKEEKAGMEQSMQMMQSSMLYVMPVMIAVFCASLPSGIGLYWASSTFYGVGQQVYINKQASNERTN